VYLNVRELRDAPGPGLTLEVGLELKSPRQVIAFAWDMARDVSVTNWWHRPAVFFGLLVWGAQQLMTRSSP